MRKSALRGVSGAVLLAALAAGTSPAWAQSTATSPAAQSEANTVGDIIVTGSNIRGTSLTTSLPVEVYSQEEMENRGSPTALEFAKSLTISGPTTGESYYFGGPTLIGSVNFNLRGIGADKTLVLLNGRRMNINTANVPFIALARTEILKDGAAVIYGADATGGVVNFITRENFVGLEMNGSYKYVDGSDGDYTFGVLGGIGSDRVNFMWSGEYEHRSRLSVLDRDLTYDSINVAPGYNPAPWSTLTNLAGWVPRGALPATPSATDVGEWGPALGLVSDFTPASCAAVGGRYDNAFTCAYNYINYYRLVENQDTYRAFAQLNAEITPDMKFHAEASYADVTVPQVMASPAQPFANGPALATGATYQIYVPITNPFAASFAARNGIAGASGFTPVTYRLHGHGGNPFYANGDGYGVPDRIENQVFRASAGLNGRVGDWAGAARDIGYDFAVTYNWTRNYNTHPDTIGYRLQQALNGFGGPNCSVTDLNPARFGTQNPALAGVGNCHWWNPFASAWAAQPTLGLANPGFIAGQENSKEVADWLFDDRGAETISNDVTIDMVFDGVLPFSLPGGEIGWALGGQWRHFNFRESVPSPIFNGSIQCEWPSNFTSGNGPGSPNLSPTPLPTTDPNFRGCTPNAPGPFVLFATNPADAADREQYSFFGELQVPLFENVDLQLAARREEFSGGLGATVYKASARWNIWGPLSLRGSYGTNYQSPPVGVLPGQITIAARTYTVAASNWLAAQFITDSNLEPETAKTSNLGLVWQSRGLRDDHSFSFILDYFNIETENQIGQIADPNQIASLVFNGAGGTITTCDPTVQPLLRRITFNAACAVGMSGVGSFSMVTTLFGNGAGQSTNGFDLQTTYTMPVGRGTFSANLTATKITELKTGATQLDGVTVTSGDDRLGYLNFATFGQAAPEWRANLNLNYNQDRHNLRLGVNYVSAVEDERPGVQYGEFGEEWITADVTYRFELNDNLALTATVANLFDRAPPPAQEEFGYDPWTANALGRTFEIGVKKRF